MVLARHIAFQLDFGILQQQSITDLLGPAVLNHLKDVHIDWFTRAVHFLNHVTSKSVNPKLRDLMVKYFETTTSLKGYLTPEASKFSDTLLLALMTELNFS